MAHKCPHKDIQFCPLYVACHGIKDSAGKWHFIGCDDGQLGTDRCAVDRAMSYAAELEKVRAVDPRLVAELQFKEQAAEEWMQAEARREKRRRMVH
jgi:hypothetical protein